MVCLASSRRFFSLISLFLLSCPCAFAADEFTGKFDPQLAPNREEMDHVIFKPFDPSSLPIKVERGATVTAARLYHAPSDKQALTAFLVETGDDDAPVIYVDANLDGALGKDERHELKQGEDDNPYILEAVINVPLKEPPFQSLPVLLQYFRKVKMDEMQEGERLVLQSTKAFARGFVDIQGKKTLVIYGYNLRGKKVNPAAGLVGVDGDGDGNIDLDRFSPEAAEAREETVVFRAGDGYVSTKKIDLEKNQIAMRSHPATDYKRVELRIGGELPDFPFTDFKGKKRRLSEFRGKYLLMDFWGTWCGPCRREMPYLKAAYRHFQPRGLEILGMNTDDAFILNDVKAWLNKNQLAWTQATLESIREVIRNYRIHAYPSTILLGPDGKILSLSQTRKGEPGLRGQGLLKTLDRLLPR